MSKLITCEHLRPVEASARASGIGIAASGNWWGSGSGNDIYFDCVLARSRIEQSFDLPDCVEWYEYDGRVSGHEAGFHCKRCNSLLVGGLAAYGGTSWPPP